MISAMLEQLFDQQRSHLSHFFDELDLKQVSLLVDRLLACEGVIFFSGVGKSGIIAEKLALTMVSTGTRALYLPPTNALHGDLGIVTDRDLFVMLSKSGESDELLRLVPYVRNKGAPLIAWVSSRGSRLERAADFTLHLPVKRELCPFNLAPTTSAAVQLIFGDVLAVVLMQAKEFSLSDYASNHPAGRIGRRILLRVSDLMLTGDALPLCHSSDSLGAKLVELSSKRCGCLLVLNDKGEISGIFTDGDLRRSLESHGPAVLEQRLESLMTRTFKSISPKTLAVDALREMEADQKTPITVLPVLEGRKLLGLIKLHDVLQSGL